MEPNLKCNYPKCKVVITGIGCVTRCSHIFCEKHKVTQEGMNSVCPACNTILEGPYSVILREVNPSEEWKSHALIGYTPEMVFEAMTQGLQFWQFQMNSELMFRKKGQEHWKLRLARRESTIEQMTLNINQYIQMETQKVNYYKNEVQSLTKTINELEGIIKEKTKQLVNLQARFESLCRRSTVSMMANAEPMEQDIDQDMLNFDQPRYRHTNRNIAPPTPQFLFPQNTSPLSSVFSASQSTPHTAPIVKPMERCSSQRFH